MDGAAGGSLRGAAGGALLALFRIARSNRSQIAEQMTRSPGAVMIYPLARACPRRAVNPSRPPIEYPGEVARTKTPAGGFFLPRPLGALRRARSVRAFLFQ